MKKIDLRKIEALLNSAISAYAISEKTGLTRAVINRYRNGEASLENMTIKTAYILQTFYNENFVNDKDFTLRDLIEELKLDIAEFGNFECWAWFKRIEGVKYYTNYDFKDADAKLSQEEIDRAKKQGEQFEILKAKHLLGLLEIENEN